MEETRVCKTCGKEYPLSMFGRYNHGATIRLHCKFCFNAMKRACPSYVARGHKPREPRVLTERDYTQLKKCIRCGLDLPLFMFNRNRRSPDGVWCYCKPCVHTMRRVYREHKKRQLQKNKE